MEQKRMSKEEFFKGWVLLTSQPWGRSYRGATAEATIQMELYFKHVDKANAVVWQAVCEYHAQSDHWPSLSELKQALVNNGGYIRPEQLAIASRFSFQEAPWPLKACWTYQGQHECSLKEAVLAVLPIWLKDNGQHEDYADAVALLEKAKQNFGVTGKAGNIRVPL